MKLVGKFGGINATGLTTAGPKSSILLFDNSPAVVLQLAELGTQTRVRGEIPRVEHQNSDLDKADVVADMRGNRGGFDEPTHEGTQRKSRRLDVAAQAVKTVGDLSPSISSNNAGAPGLPAVSSSTRRVAITKSGAPKTKRPTPAPEVDL